MEKNFLKKTRKYFLWMCQVCFIEDLIVMILVVVSFFSFILSLPIFYIHTASKFYVFVKIHFPIKEHADLNLEICNKKTYP